MACLVFGILVFVALKENNFILGYRAGSLIWSRSREIFIPIENVSTFNAVQQVYLRKSRELEIHNFQKEILRVAYFQENNIINFCENDTKMTGASGEIWNMLAEYLNFTMVTIKTKKSQFGTKLPNGSYSGLLGMLTRGETDIIPRSGYYVDESEVMAFTTPVWNNRYRLFIRPELTSDTSWMLNMFSRYVWCSMLLIFLFMSVLGYAIQKISIRISGDKNVYHTLHDHLFYTFGTLCCQGYIPDSLYQRTKILGLSKKMFSWLVLTTLSSHLISYTTNKKVQPPFEDIDTMLNSTTYDIVVFDGSLVYEKFKAMTRNLEANERYKGRFHWVNTTDRMYELGCWGIKKYAILDSEDRQRAYGRFKCRLVPTGVSYFPTWVTAGVSKNVKYKRTLDVSILKFTEFGLTDGLKDRWMATNVIDVDENILDSVKFDQVLILFTMLCMGMTTAIGIFILENAVFLYNCNRRKIKIRTFYLSRGKRMTQKKNHY